MRKKTNFGMIFSLIFLFVLALMLVFAYWQLNRQANKLDDIQNIIVENSQSANAIVNFINSGISQNQP